MDKIWLQHYEKGVPATIAISPYPSLTSLLEEACEKYATNTAYVNFGTKLTYQELEKTSRSVALFFIKLGLKKGDRIGLMMPNLLQYPISLLAALRLGLIIVNINPLYTAQELTHQAKDAGLKAIIVLANYAKTVEIALPHIPSLQHILITEVGDVFPFLKRKLFNAIVRYIKKAITPYYLPQAIPFLKALQEKPEPLPPTPLSPTDIAFLQYTGGTTGIAKGAMLSHGNLLANVLQASAWVQNPCLHEKDIVVTALPLYHIFSLTANCLIFLKAGAKNILITDPRNVQQFIADIKNARFTMVTGVNTLFNALLHHPHFHKIDFSHLRISLAGGMALQEKVASLWYEKTNNTILQAYGLTEASPAVSMNPMYVEKFNGSIGLPLPSTEISIRDVQGQEVAVLEEGELLIKGPQVMQGYWQKSEENQEVFAQDGFLHTGDIVTMDEKGFLHLVDRKKDLIIVSGFNVYPNEVEQIISMHPDVLEVGVIGVVDKNGNEQVKACIVKRNPAVTKKAILAFCKAQLTLYKIPKVIEFYQELPKTNVGKILRRSLKELM